MSESHRGSGPQRSRARRVVRLGVGLSVLLPVACARSDDGPSAAGSTAATAATAATATGSAAAESATVAGRELAGVRVAVRRDPG